MLPASGICCWDVIHSRNSLGGEHSTINCRTIRTPPFQRRYGDSSVPRGSGNCCTNRVSQVAGCGLWPSTVPPSNPLIQCHIVLVSPSSRRGRANRDSNLDCCSMFRIPCHAPALSEAPGSPKSGGGSGRRRSQRGWPSCMSKSSPNGVVSSITTVSKEAPRGRSGSSQVGLATWV